MLVRCPCCCGILSQTMSDSSDVGCWTLGMLRSASCFALSASAAKPHSLFAGSSHIPVTGQGSAGKRAEGQQTAHFTALCPKQTAHRPNRTAHLKVRSIKQTAHLAALSGKQTAHCMSISTQHSLAVRTQHNTQQVANVRQSRTQCRPTTRYCAKQGGWAPEAGPAWPASGQRTRRRRGYHRRRRARRGPAPRRGGRRRIGAAAAPPAAPARFAWSWLSRLR